MGNPAAEKNIFAAFLEAVPSFAGDKIANWTQPADDPPDVLCTTEAGLQVGLELTEWIDNRQMTDAKAKEAFERSILDAIRPEPPNNTEHIHLVWLLTLSRARVKPVDKLPFRSELLNLVEEVDANWSGEPDWQSPQGCWWRDFSRYPKLGKYLSEVRFFPHSAFGGRSNKGGQHWLTFPFLGGSYSEHSMLTALRSRLRDKIEKYAARPGNLKEFVLLIYHDQALIYNSPVETLMFKFADAAGAGADFVGDDAGAFDRIFLFVPHESERKSFQLYPRDPN